MAITILISLMTMLVLLCMPFCTLDGYLLNLGVLQTKIHVVAAEPHVFRLGSGAGPVATDLIPMPMRNSTAHKNDSMYDTKFNKTSSNMLYVATPNYSQPSDALFVKPAVPIQMQFRAGPGGSLSNSVGHDSEGEHDSWGRKGLRVPSAEKSREEGSQSFMEPHLRRLHARHLSDNSLPGPSRKFHYWTCTKLCE